MRWWNQGTPGAAGGTSEVTGEHTPQSGTPNEQARNAQDENVVKLNMQWKDSTEKLNRLMAKYGASTPEELDDKLSQPPGATDDEDQGYAPSDPEDEADLISAAKGWVGKGDKVAALTLKLTKRIEALEKRNEALIKATANEFDLRDLPEAERNRVVRHYQRNKHRFGDLKAAAADLEAPALRDEVKALKDKLELLEREPNPQLRNAPSTGGGRDTTVLDNTPTVSRAEFDRLKKSKDANDMMSSLALQRQISGGKLRITP